MRSHHRVLKTALAVALVASLAIAPAVAAQDVPSARIGSCSAYSGLPGETEADGMTFVPAGTFSMGSNRHRPEERYTHVVPSTAFGSTAPRSPMPNLQSLSRQRATSLWPNEAAMPNYTPTCPRSSSPLALSLSSCRRTSATAAASRSGSSTLRPPTGVTLKDPAVQLPAERTTRWSTSPTRRTGLRRLAGTQPAHRGAMGVRGAW
jgi:hypothetical protein